MSPPPPKARQPASVRRGTRSSRRIRGRRYGAPATAAYSATISAALDDCNEEALRVITVDLWEQVLQRAIDALSLPRGRRHRSGLDARRERWLEECGVWLVRPMTAWAASRPPRRQASITSCACGESRKRYPAPLRPGPRGTPELIDAGLGLGFRGGRGAALLVAGSSLGEDRVHERRGASRRRARRSAPPPRAPTA
jgi:hypothetical protein